MGSCEQRLGMHAHALSHVWAQNVGVYLHTEQDHLEVQTDNETVVAVEAFLQAHQGWVQPCCPVAVSSGVAVVASSRGCCELCGVTLLRPALGQEATLAVWCHGSAQHATRAGAT